MISGIAMLHRRVVNVVSVVRKHRSGDSAGQIMDLPFLNDANKQYSPDDAMK